MFLATFSDELKLFNTEESFSLSASTLITNQKNTFGNITWSGDGKLVAVTPVKDSNDLLPIFKPSGNRLIPVKQVPITSVTSASFFNWTNRNIAIGTETGHVYVYDLKDKKIAISVDTNQKHTVDHIHVNSDDACIASGSLNTSRISVHSLKTNKVVQTFSIPQSERTSCLTFSMCKKSYLALSSYESTIYVWDLISSRAAYKAFNSHGGACTGVAFSPVNYTVLASVGLTKRLKMYDLREKSCIFEAIIGEPLCSVDMILNDKVAVGTSNGSVFVYDLRMNEILTGIKAHDDSVLSVKKQIMKIKESYEEADSKTPEIESYQSKTLDLSVMDVFSPISANNQTYSDKNLSCQSSPRFIVEARNNSVSNFQDSFLSKMMSPKKENIFMSTPVEKPSFDSKKSDIMNNTSKLGTVEEETFENNEIQIKCEVNPIESGGAGDNMNISHSLAEISHNSFLREIKEIHEEIRKLSDKISSVENQLLLIQSDNECKFQCLLENHKTLLEYLITGIKQEVYNGNCDGKLEHICLRLLINNVSGLVSDKSDQVVAEVNNCVQKINMMQKLIANFKNDYK